MMRTIVVQAGGESRRMGQNKALMPFLGRPLVARVLSRLAPLADELIVTANDPSGFESLAVSILPDVLPGNGALGGLYTAVHVAANPAVGVVACDMPFASPTLLAAQFALLEQEQVDVVIPSSPEGLEPMHAVYRRSACLPAIARALESGQRRLISFFPAVKVRVMSVDEAAVHDPSGRAFLNVNTLEEFAQAEALAVAET